MACIYTGYAVLGVTPVLNHRIVIPLNTGSCAAETFRTGLFHLCSRWMNSWQSCYCQAQYNRFSIYSSHFPVPASCRFDALPPESNNFGFSGEHTVS